MRTHACGFIQRADDRRVKGAVSVCGAVCSIADIHALTSCTRKPIPPLAVVTTRYLRDDSDDQRNAQRGAHSRNAERQPGGTQRPRGGRPSWSGSAPSPLQRALLSAARSR